MEVYKIDSRLTYLSDSINEAVAKDPLFWNNYEIKVEPKLLIEDLNKQMDKT